MTTKSNARPSTKLTKLSLSNFKAFGSEVEIEFRRITLIFGANSSGKSSVIHALLLLNELIAKNTRRPGRFLASHTLVQNPLNVTSTLLGGTSLDLGGYPYYLYKHDPSKQATFGISTLSILEKSDSIAHTHASRNLITMSTNRSPNGEEEASFCSKYFLDNEHLVTSETIFSQSIGLSYFSRVIYENHPIVFFTLRIVYLKSLEFWKLVISADMKTSDTYNEEILTIFEKLSDDSESQSKFHKNVLTLLNDSAGPKAGSSMNFDASHSLLTLTGFFSNEIINKSFAEIFEAVGFPKKYHKYEELANFNPSNSMIMDALFREKNNEQIPLQCVKLYTSTEDNIIVNYSASEIVLSKLKYLGPLRSIPARSFYQDTETQISSSDGSESWASLPNKPMLLNKINDAMSKYSIPYTLRAYSPAHNISIDRVSFESLIMAAENNDIDEVNSISKHIKSSTHLTPGKVMIQLVDIHSNTTLSPRDVGVGISQVLPILVECFGSKNATICIEQPELHLHPKLQGDLSDLFIETSVESEQNNTYIIETHSEHIIRRLMRRVREGKISKDDISIVYVEPGPNGSTVSPIRMDEDGDLIDEWPNGFFEEGFRDHLAGR